MHQPFYNNQYQHIKNDYSIKFFFKITHTTSTLTFFLNKNTSETTNEKPHKNPILIPPPFFYLNFPT